MERDSGDWRKGSHSGGNGGSCVEVAPATPGVLVRDTTNRAGAVLAISATAWRALLAEIQH
jgi:hypothetical protein